MMPRAFPATLVFIAAFVFPAQDAQDEGSAEQLVGEYVIVSGEKSGMAEPPERVQGSKVQFSKERIVVTDKDSKEIYGATYRLDTTKNPWRITMVSKLADQEETVAKGLIEKSGDTVKLIYALPNGDEPTEFKTKENQLMFVMKQATK